MRDRKKFTLGIGDIRIDTAPSIITTYLGSCVAVCLYEPSEKIGGMVHIAMTEAPGGAREDGLRLGKYADTGIKDLWEQLQKTRRVNGARLTAKIFGGARLFKMTKRDIGQENTAAVLRVLKEMGIAVAASQTGGDKGYRIEFDLTDGRVICQIFGGQLKEY